MPAGQTGRRYVSKWERLLATLERVTSSGLQEKDAMQDICDAIADRMIEVRLALREHTTRHFRVHGRTFAGADVDIPTRLDVEEIDFHNSRPLKPWLVPREKNAQLAGYWTIDWIELSSADVTKVLLQANTTSAEQLNEKGPLKSSPHGGRKSQVARERVRRILREIYPDGVPDQATEPNSILCRNVGVVLKKRGLRDVSNDTILRAAERRK